jgi:hypothetical protein
VLEAFLSRVIPEPNSGCWLWEGPVSDRGYGYVYRNWERFLAHREHWRLAGREEVPLLRHTCDTPCCVNLDHLLPGTKYDNWQDAVQRGRWKPGQGSGGGSYPKKLNPDAIRDIRASKGPGRIMAAKYGVDVSLIYQIRARKIWAHIPAEG